MLPPLFKWFVDACQAQKINFPIPENENYIYLQHNKLYNKIYTMDSSSSPPNQAYRFAYQIILKVFNFTRHFPKLMFTRTANLQSVLFLT